MAKGKRARCLLLFFHTLTRGGTSSEGAEPWGEGLCWGWECADDDEDGDEDGGWWWCWWGSWLRRRWRLSKLGTSASLKECERDMRGGGAAAECDVAMLPLLFRAARCERTLQTTQKEEHSAGAWVSLHARQGIMGNFMGFGD